MLDPTLHVVYNFFICTIIHLLHSSQRLMVAVNHAPPPVPAQASSGGSMFGSIGSTIAQGREDIFPKNELYA